MQKFDHVLLASDFDNTLVYTQSALDNGTDIPPMCPRNREALDYFIQNGGLFAISTGRALPAFMDYAKDVPMSAPCVIANGAAIYDFRANEYLYTAFLGKAIYDHMAEVLARFPTLAFEVYHDDCRIHAMNPNRYIRNHEHLTRSPVQVVERFTDIDLPIIKILFEEDFPVLDAVRTFILSRPWGREYELIYSNEHLLELTAAGATKGGMILRLASLLGVARKDIYCIGDHKTIFRCWRSPPCPSRPRTPFPPYTSSARTSSRIAATARWPTWWSIWIRSTEKRKAVRRTAFLFYRVEVIPLPAWPLRRRRPSPARRQSTARSARSAW